MRTCTARRRTWCTRATRRDISGRWWRPDRSWSTAPAMSIRVGRANFWYPWPVTWGWGPFDLGFGVDVFTGFEFGFAVGPYWGWHHGWGWHGGCCWGWHHGISHVNVYHHWCAHVHITGNHFIDHGNIRGGRFGGGNVY